MTVRDLVKQLLDLPLDAQVLLRVYVNEEDERRTEIDVERVGKVGDYVAIDGGAA